MTLGVLQLIVTFLVFQVGDWNHDLMCAGVLISGMILMPFLVAWEIKLLIS